MCDHDSVPPQASDTAGFAWRLAGDYARAGVTSRVLFATFAALVDSQDSDLAARCLTALEAKLEIDTGRA